MTPLASQLLLAALVGFSWLLTVLVVVPAIKATGRLLYGTTLWLEEDADA